MTRLESFASGEGFPVDLKAIERELAAVWKSAQEEPGAGDAPITRACRLNLIVACDGIARARWVDEVVAGITRECPSRAIVAVVEGRSVADRLDASISAHCAFVPGAGHGRQVCCEQITLTGSGRGAQRLPGAVLPLLLPDLPVAVWYAGRIDFWKDGPYEAMARALGEPADRIVLDSRTLRDPWQGLTAILEMPRAIGDLAWQRLRGWRETTAAFFDDPAYESYPPLISRMHAVYAAPAGVDPQGPHAQAGAAEAILLLCWAASRLAWRPAPGGRAVEGPSRMILKRPGAGAGGDGEMVLEARASEHPAGQVLAFTMEAGDASFRLERTAAIDCVTASVTLPSAGPLLRSARIPEREDATLLCRCLEPGDTDPVYLETIRLAADLADHVEDCS